MLVAVAVVVVHARVIIVIGVAQGVASIASAKAREACRASAATNKIQHCTKHCTEDMGANGNRPNRHQQHSVPNKHHKAILLLVLNDGGADAPKGRGCALLQWHGG